MIAGLAKAASGIFSGTLGKIFGSAVKGGAGTMVKNMARQFITKQGGNLLNKGLNFVYDNVLSKVFGDNVS